MWFIPNSGLTKAHLANIPTQVAQRFPDANLQLLKTLFPNATYPEYSLDHLILTSEQGEQATRLSSIFSKHGSDKSSAHRYHLLYSPILNNLYKGKPPSILEIGLGSNNPNIPSSMGVNGKPGASLRAFREFAPDALVHGADIDSSITVDSCEIYYIDQTNPESFSAIFSTGRQYDLIIDDGLHSPDANFFTLNFALQIISNDGVIVIEDIGKNTLSIWRAAQYLFGTRGYQTFLIEETSNTYAFVVTRLKNLFRFSQ